MNVDSLIKVEDRKSTGTLFVSLPITDGSVKKSIDVYYVYADLPVHQERKESLVGRFGLEIYQGPNYVPPFTSRERSYSRHYAHFLLAPEKYRKEILPKLVSRLVEEMGKRKIRIPSSLAYSPYLR